MRPADARKGRRYCIQTAPRGHLQDENCSWEQQLDHWSINVNAEVFVPAILFICLTVVLCLFFWFRFRSRSDMQATIRTAIDKGQELSPEIIDRLGQPRPHKDRDLRLALIWLALAVALALFGLAIPEHDNEAQQVFLGIAAFPLSLGIAFLIMWKFTERQR